MDHFRQIRYLVAPASFSFASIIWQVLENPYSRRNRRCSTYARRLTGVIRHSSFVRARRGILRP